MTPTRQTLFLLAAVLATGVCGCLKYTKPVVAQPEMTGAERNFEAVWLATQDVLRDYRFTIDRQDKRAGVITTEPLTGMQFFEFWRKDAVTPEALLAGSIQTLHRTVTVRIRPAAGQAEQYEPAVQVAVSKPYAATDVRSTSDAYSMFLLPGEQDLYPSSLLGVAPPAVEEQAARSAGTDVKLASKLRDEIVAAAAKRLARAQ